jgi:hypothetical protein
VDGTKTVGKATGGAIGRGAKAVVRGTGTVIEKTGEGLGKAGKKIKD